MNEPSVATTTSPVQKVLLLLAGTLAGLLLAEGVVRLSGLAPEVVLVQEGRFRLSPNEKIGYEPVPNFDYEGTTDSFYDYVGKSNSLGFRDRDHTVEKPEGTFRILLLGDSVSVGQGVPRAEGTYPVIVEKYLRARGLEVELLNFAVTGYNTQQEVWTLHDKGLDFDPDLVLVGYCLNDRKRSDGGVLTTLLEQQKAAEGPLSSRVRSHPLLLRSALFRLLRYRVLPTPPEPPPEMIYGDTVDESLEFLARLRDQHGFRVMMVVFPRFGGLLEYQHLAEHQRLEVEARRHGFDWFDLLPAFQECRRQLTGKLGLDRYHPSRMGHRCAGDALGKELFSRWVELGIPSVQGGAN
jgi:lysophospholipase L1-like esterase